MKSLTTFFAYLFAGIFILSLSSCKDSEPVLPSYGFTIEFDNVVGDRNLVLNGPASTNARGESFVITKFNYFISNIKLLRSDGSSYVVPQDSSYFLIMEDKKESQFVRLKNVPVGEYSGVEFMVGVDSLRSTSPIEKRKGVLDPGGSMMEDGMYWLWNSGYIFVKLEGTSPVGNPVNDKFYYHIGLFGGYEKRTVNNTRIVKVDFGALKAPVTTEKAPEVHLLVDVLKIFDGPGTSISIEEHNSIMGQQEIKSQEVADNYAQMFTLDHIH